MASVFTHTRELPPSATSRSTKSARCHNPTQNATDRPFCHRPPNGLPAPLPSPAGEKIMANPKTTPHDAQRFLDVLVVGEALVDVVTTPDGQVEHPGGSPANVAYGLGLLGVATGLLTAIAPDARGTLIEEHLHRAGVTLLPGSKLL